jgi:hypothetical protein
LHRLIFIKKTIENKELIITAYSKNAGKAIVEIGIYTNRI